MSAAEKRLWVSLAALVLAFGGYFYSAWSTLFSATASANVSPQQAWTFILATIVLVVIVVAGNVVVALLDRHTEEDERDRLILLRGGRFGSFVLATGVFLALCCAPLTHGNATMAHVLLGAWVLAQGVEIVSQLVMYRRGC